MYPGCCGHENRQGWYAMFGYFLYGIPHPYLGDWLEPRFNKTEFLVRYSGVNQRAILANDISHHTGFRLQRIALRLQPACARGRPGARLLDSTIDCLADRG